MNPTSQSCRPHSANSTTSSATVRPRNRRLEPDPKDRFDPVVPITGASSTSVGSPFTSPRPSRAVSPIPSKHPSRPTGKTHLEHHNLPGRGSLGAQPSGRSAQPTPPGFTSGLWGNSWSTLQGLASTVLGNELTTGDGKNIPGPSLRLPPRKRFLSDTISRQKYPNQPPTQWGPKGATESNVGIGSKQSREELLRAKRREDLLEANDHALTDTLGRFKRRSSDDRASSSAPPDEHDSREALVYVHKVRPDDTLAGVMIKFNCQPAVFRKANRLWPNDSIQTRKTVVLPVEACAIKGTPVPEPPHSPDVDIAGWTGGEETTPTLSNGPWGDFSTSSKASDNAVANTPSHSSTSEHHEDPPWRHDSWVQIKGHSSAVEIARLSRHYLGYFPRGRRKSGAYSELDTPPPSLDIPHLPYSDSSPGRLKTRSSSGSYLGAQLHGPGGVGTLGRNVKSPGPEQDGLNRLFAAHLPNVAPRDSFESTTSASSTGLENVGGAIEGWVRKIAIKAATIVDGPPARGYQESGDLIELRDALEVVEDSIEDTSNRYDYPVSGSASAVIDQENLLRERFLPRGRLLQDDAKRTKGD